MSVQFEAQDEAHGWHPGVAQPMAGQMEAIVGEAVRKLYYGNKQYKQNCRQFLIFGRKQDSLSTLKHFRHTQIIDSLITSHSGFI